MNSPAKVIVSVREGKIQGYRNRSPFSGAEFYSFLGVPYGKSTAGQARFKDPEEVKPWTNILKADTGKGGCLQFSLKTRNIVGSEDCLYNNIHTPQIPQKHDGQPLKAVIVLIHPGSSHTGSPDPDYFGSPDYIMHNDVVYVGVSFRIHILGFLNLNLKECSGNQGIKDIILSLQWIQKNISNFGGDPNNITLIGISVGAIIANELMISPRAKGLFHKAIIMGSYKYSPNVIIREENFTISFQLAQKLGYSGPCDSKKLLMFYKKLDLNKFFFTRPERLYNEDWAPIFPSSPYFPSPEFGENPAVQSTDKQKLLESMARIPLMIGFCERESVMGFLEPFRKSTMDNFYNSIRQNFWGWGNKLNDNQLKFLQKRIESYYLEGKSIESGSLPVKCDIQTDIALSDLYPSLIDVIAADLPSSVYVYKFLFEGNVNKMRDLFEFSFEEILTGTFHTEDFTYWTHFQRPYEKIENPLTPETEKMVNTFTKLLCTFAKTGNPNYDGMTIQWKPTTVENPCYLSINNDLHMEDGKLNGKRMEFWEKLKKELEENDLNSAFSDQKVDLK